MIKNLIQKLPSDIQNQRRGLVLDESLRVKGAPSVWALGDCSATQWAPTAQVASSQGNYLASIFNSKEADSSNPRPFEYTHLGSLAYLF